MCFLFFWAINMWVIYKGIESIRILLNIKAPLLIGLGLVLLAWAYFAAGGFGDDARRPSAFEVGGPKAGQFWAFFFASLTANVGFWATLSLNIPDFSRYAYSQRDQVLGQALGLPTTMALFSFIGIAVTGATAVIYGETIWDPVVVLSKFNNPVVLVVAMFSLCIATLATNIAANVVSPANDFAHLAPQYISFRTGGFITGIIGILMQPWKLVDDPTGYIFSWLVAYSALLGAVGGVLIADYLRLGGRRSSISPACTAATAPTGTAAASIPSPSSPCCWASHPACPVSSPRCQNAGKVDVPAFWADLYHYAWFISFGVSFVAYLVLMNLFVRNDKNA